jgi:hypothetical protein
MHNMVNVIKLVCEEPEFVIYKQIGIYATFKYVIKAFTVYDCIMDKDKL